jgi:hypothetical protein
MAVNLFGKLKWICQTYQEPYTCNLSMIKLLLLFLLATGCASTTLTRSPKGETGAILTCCEAIIKYNINTELQYQPFKLTFSIYQSDVIFKEFQHRVDITLNQYFLWSGTLAPYSVLGGTTEAMLNKPLLYVCNYPAFAFRKVKQWSTKIGGTGDRVTVLGRYVGSSLEIESGQHKMIIPLLEDCYIFSAEECQCR